MKLICEDNETGEQFEESEEFEEPPVMRTKS